MIWTNLRHYWWNSEQRTKAAQHFARQQKKKKKMYAKKNYLTIISKNLVFCDTRSILYVFVDVIKHTTCLKQWFWRNFDEILPVIKGAIAEEEIITRGFSQVPLQFYLDVNNKKHCFDNAQIVQQNGNSNRSVLVDKTF